MSSVNCHNWLLTPGKVWTVGNIKQDNAGIKSPQGLDLSITCIFECYFTCCLLQVRKNCVALRAILLFLCWPGVQINYIFHQTPSCQDFLQSSREKKHSREQRSNRTWRLGPLKKAHKETQKEKPKDRVRDRLKSAKREKTEGSSWVCKKPQSLNFF